MKKQGNDIVGLILYYIGIFFVLREWLVPIMQLTDTGFVSLFLLFIALALLLNLLKVPVAVAWFIKLFYIAWFLSFVYIGAPIFAPAAWAFLSQELQYNLATILTGDFVQVTDPFRTSLFFVLIWMLVYLIHHWVTVRSSIFYFFAMTVFFIATLDTFTPYDGTVAIVRVVIIGLFMTGLLYIKQLTTERHVFKYIAFTLPLILVIGASAMAAYYLPKSEPIWPDPVPYIKSLAGQGGAGSSVSKVGYDEDDSQLGGGFVEDDTVVFKAIAPERQYWRIETKDMYTSKGWEQSPDEIINVYTENTPIEMNMPIGVKEEESIVSFDMNLKFPFVFQPYGMYSVSTNERIENLAFTHNMDSGKLLTLENGRDVTLNQYDVVFREPTYSLTALRQTTLDAFDPYALGIDRYLQLPVTLPERVGQLAFDITKEKTSVYDKVRAIEGYFARSGFRYNTEDIAVPGEGQDYVDQFLFETKVGYCDNFSSSMTVMLRTLGIPARWVKGFAPGEQGSAVDGMYEYTVTNNDAHSWVEAYLPGIGWMPFEPTIGFSGVNNIDFDVEISDQERDELQPEERQQLEQQEQNKEQKTQATKDKDATKLFSDLWKNIVTWLKQYQAVFYWIAAGLIATAIWLYFIRLKWLPKVYVSKYRKKGIDETSYEKVYDILLKQLKTYGLKREPGETLAAFATRVDEHFETGHMRRLTAVYEMYIYSKTFEKVDFEKLQESWEYLINRMSS